MNRLTVSDMSRVRLTRHADRQCSARGVTGLMLVDALTRPAVVEPSGTARRFVSRQGVVLVVVENGDRLLVVTVLLRSRSQWADADCRVRWRADEVASGEPPL